MGKIFIYDEFRNIGQRWSLEKKIEAALWK
jgi:hypothetical protein